jgi:hypothetical protein
MYTQRELPLLFCSASPPTLLGPPPRLSTKEELFVASAFVCLYNGIIMILKHSHQYKSASSHATCSEPVSSFPTPSLVAPSCTYPSNPCRFAFMVALEAYHVLTPEDMKEQAIRSGKGKDCGLEQLGADLQNFNLNLPKRKRSARPADWLLGPLMSVPLDVCYAVSYPFSLQGRPLMSVTDLFSPAAS